MFSSAVAWGRLGWVLVMVHRSSLYMAACYAAGSALYRYGSVEVWM